MRRAEEPGFAPSTYTRSAAPGRLLQQQQFPSGSSSISSTTAQAIGIVFGGVLLIIVLSYCLTVMRRKRDRAQAEMRLQAQAEHDEQRRAARAERRRRRLEPKGVPISIVETFPTKQFMPPEKPLTENRVDRTTRGKMMTAATSALAISLDHDADSDGHSDTSPPPPPAPDTPSTPSTMLGKVTSVLRSRSRRYGLTPRPSADPENVPSVTSPAPWEVDPRDMDPSRSLAAAHRAACAAASQMGRNPPMLRRNSSDKIETQGSSRLAMQASGRLQMQQSSRLGEEGFKDPLSHLPEGDEEQPQCAICLCDFEPGDMLRVLPCEHDFHQPCIDSWMQQHRTCPLCRHVLFAEPAAPAPAGPEEADNEPEVAGPPLPPRYPPLSSGPIMT